MHRVETCGCVHCRSTRIAHYFFGITLRPELMVVTDVGTVAFRPLRCRFSDVLETTELRLPDFVVRHPDDALACLSLLFCLRRFCSGFGAAEDSSIDFHPRPSKA